MHTTFPAFGRFNGIKPLLAVRPEGRTDKPKAGKVRQEARRDYCLTAGAIRSVCFSQTGVIADVTGSSFHKCCYEEQEKRKQFFREDFN